MSITGQNGTFAFAIQSTPYGEGTVAAQKAKGRVVINTNPSVSRTLVVGSVTYTLVTSTPASANEVKIGATRIATAANIAAAINAGAGSGTLYGTGTTANSDADAVASNATVFLTADTAGAAGNSLTLTGFTEATVTAFSGGQTSGNFDASALSFRKMRGRAITYDIQQMAQPMPLQVGSEITPFGAYKAGTFLEGGASVIPPFEGSFGELLFGALGSVTTQANTPETGTHTHTFKFKPTDQTYLPWIAVRKGIPGSSVARAKGIIGYDNKIGALVLTIPQTGPVEAEVSFRGRVPVGDNYPESWISATDYESFRSVAQACKGYFKILSTVISGELPITGVQVAIQNNLSTPEMEMITGSYFMDDITVLTRAVTLRTAYKWNNPELYERSYFGSSSGTTWSPEPFVTTSDGAGDYAFEAFVEAPYNIGSTTTPFSLKIRANQVFWQPSGPLQLLPGQILMQEYQGTLLSPDSSSDAYVEFILVNNRSSYA